VVEGLPDRPLRGAGIGLRRRHFADIGLVARELDFVEIIPENYVGKGGHALRVLDACVERWPVLAHGVSMSIAGPDPLDHHWLRGLKRLLDRIGAPFYTDHLCFATVFGQATFDLIPPPFSDDAVEHCASRLRELADALERPVAVENISYYATMPGSSMAEAEFVRAVVEQADCLLLLDVNNVYVNAQNHGQDPDAALAALPLERACQIHLAGHRIEGPRLLDDHGAPVCDPVWELYRAALRRCGPIPTLIEWDTNIPALDRVLDEADRARAIQAES
jgi:uncharacterized protein